MTVDEMVAQLDLRIYAAGDTQRVITGGYAADLLSCVMAKAQPGNVWVTLQAHPNVVAVASLLGLSAVIVSEGVKPDLETVDRAQENGVVLLGTPLTTYGVVGRLSGLGVTAG